MTYDVLLLGAGLSGLQAARDLQAAGKSVLVLDKGRGVGGRAATRRWDGVPVDHGAQFFTARSPEFRAQVADWITRGVCFEWAKGFHQWDKDAGLQSPDADKEAGHPRHACRAGMSALGKDLAAGLGEGSVRMGARVLTLGWVDGIWQAHLEGAAEPVSGRRLVSTLPVPQALALFEQSSAENPAVRDTLDAFVLSKLRAVETAPSLAVMLRGDVPAPEWQAVQLRDETITWIGADSDKREPSASADGKRVFVLHGSGPFSREWQDRDLNEAADRIVTRAGEIVGGWITKLPERQMHRWRYSSVPHGLENDAFLQNGVYGEAGGRPPVYFAGDTFMGSKVEGAYRRGARWRKPSWRKFKALWKRRFFGIAARKFRPFRQGAGLTLETDATSALAAMTLPGLLSTALGVGLLGLVAYDVYATILHSRARAGPIGQNLNRRVWWIARKIAFRCSRARRHVILNAIGPLLLPAFVVILILLLMLGFALIYWPRMPGSFNVDEKARSPTWIEAFYFSGTTLTTLGYGDISPRTTSMRLVALAEVTSGFAFISLAVTYLLTVTNALERKRTVALSFYHQAERGADAAGFLRHHFRRNDFQGLEHIFASAARDLQSLLESHVEHPVIHYFHPVEVHKSLPRMLFLVLEIRSVMKCCLDRKVYADICAHPEAETLEETARYVLRQLSTFVNLRVGTADQLPPETPETEFPRWFRRFDQTMTRFAVAGIQTQPDMMAGRRRYVKNRLEWEQQLGAFAAFAGYDWDEITGDRDLQEAEDHPSEPDPV